MQARWLLVLAGLAAGSHGVPAIAGGSAAASGIASATIVEPIALRSIDPLQFGVIAAARSGSGSITVDPQTGASTFSGSLAPACPHNASCFARPAQFGVTGEAGRRYRIDAPQVASAVRQEGGYATLPISAIRIWVGSGSAQDSRGLLDASGNDSFRVGGTLSVPAGTEPGIYQAELAVVVSYD